MEITQAFLSEVQAQFDFCHLYGITQDPSTLEYLFIMRFAPQGDLRRYLLRNFDNLSLSNKLGIAQTICAELKKIHAKGWVHGDLHSGNILLLNEENAFISDFGLCRPIDEVESEEKLYGVIPNVAPEMFYGKPRSQEGDIYSLGVILWELMCGIIAFADRPHNESLVLDIVFNGLRPQTCHFAPPVYNDLLKRCWDQDSSKRPSIYEVTDFIEKLCGFRIRDKKQNFGDTHLFKSRTGLERPLCQQLVNSHNAGCIYNLMKWKPNKPTHPEAVYTSRLLSYKEYLLSRSKE
ncbi:kinase-like protein [Rhizophagus irregularis]|uniref:Kinase-like protein n=1 Tax=Rhizophagus irregularis TaxID=588596 RepID=A0A2I1GS79_9GLOM|nr:kinase-like protein [Rhizophagus irregularis]